MTMTISQSTITHLYRRNYSLVLVTMLRRKNIETSRYAYFDTSQFEILKQATSEWSVIENRL